MKPTTPVQNAQLIRNLYATNTLDHEKKSNNSSSENPEAAFYSSVSKAEINEIIKSYSQNGEALNEIDTIEILLQIMLSPTSDQNIDDNEQQTITNRVNEAGKLIKDKIEKDCDLKRKTLKMSYELCTLIANSEKKTAQSCSLFCTLAKTPKIIKEYVSEYCRNYNKANPFDEAYNQPPISPLASKREQETPLSSDIKIKKANLANVEPPVSSSSEAQIAQIPVVSSSEAQMVPPEIEQKVQTLFSLIDTPGEKEEDFAELRDLYPDYNEIEEKYLQKTCFEQAMLLLDKNKSRLEEPINANLLSLLYFAYMSDEYKAAEKDAATTLDSGQLKLLVDIKTCVEDAFESMSECDLRSANRFISANTLDQLAKQSIDETKENSYPTFNLTDDINALPINQLNEIFSSPDKNHYLPIHYKDHFMLCGIYKQQPFIFNSLDTKKYEGVTEALKTAWEEAVKERITDNNNFKEIIVKKGDLQNSGAPNSCGLQVAEVIRRLSQASSNEAADPAKIIDDYIEELKDNPIVQENFNRRKRKEGMMAVITALEAINS